MQMIEVSKLIPHPRNNEFFDDITGSKWEDFLKSVSRRGVVEAITVSQDLVIISGHQRVRACKELNMLEVPCRITHYPEIDEKTGNFKEDLILEDLISTNILQRGIGNINPMKMAKCIIEMERIYNIKKGGSRFHGNQYIKNVVISNLKTQKDLANQIHLTEKQLRNYKTLINLIPELQDLVESGELKATTAYKIWAKLSPEKQEEFISKIGKDNIINLTEKETKNIINRKPIPQTTIKHLINKSKGYCEICNWGGLGLEGILLPHHTEKYCNTKSHNIDKIIMVCPNCHSIIHTLENCKDKNMIDIILNSIDKNIKNEIINYVSILNSLVS